MTTPQTPNNRINLFFDMDGVLAVYEPEAYMVSPLYDQLPYIEQDGYFAKRPADDGAVYLFNRYVTTLRHTSEPDVHVHTLSTIPNNTSLALRMAHDKRYWMERQIAPCPRHVQAANFPDRNMLFAYQGDPSRSKVETAKRALGRDLCAQDVLIDDFNDNLIAWTRAGGTAIKYLNGINSPTDEFKCITCQGKSHSDVAAELDAYLASLISTPAQDETSNEIKLARTDDPAGHIDIIASLSDISGDDISKDAIDIVFQNQSMDLQDICEVKRTSNGISIKVWGDPYSEDFTEEFLIPCTIVD